MNSAALIERLLWELSRFVSEPKEVTLASLSKALGTE